MKFKKLLMMLALAIVVTACANNSGEETETPATEQTEAPATEETTQPETTEEETAEAPVVEAPEFEGTAIELRRGYAAPHSEQAFSSIGVILEGDKILDAEIDEYQFGDPATFDGVPNSDKDFGDGYAENVVLYSKADNDDDYSTVMKDSGKATKSLEENYEAIEDFVKNKTIGEVQATIDASEDGKPVDAVSGATLVDTVGYLEAIVDVAENGYISHGAYDPNNSEEVELKRELSAPHGTRSFADVMVAEQGDTIVAASIDEFQFMEGEAIPNGDKKLGEGFADAKAPLISKLENNAAYSNVMKNSGKATKTLGEGYKAIEHFVVGKTEAEVMEVVNNSTPGEPVDAVSSSTLVDTSNYLKSIAEVD